MDRGNFGHAVDSLLTLIEVSRDLGAPIGLQALLARIEQASLRVLDCERVTVFLYDRSRQQLYSRLATGAVEIRMSTTQGIAGAALETRALINVSDAYADSRFYDGVDRCTGFRTKNLLAVPLTGFDGDVVGVLEILDRKTGRSRPRTKNWP